MLSPRVHTPAGKSRFGPPPHTPRSSITTTSTTTRPDGSSKVRVVVRVRPFLPSEIQHSNGLPRSCLSISKGNSFDKDDTLHITDSKTSRQGSYKLDFCYGEKEDISLIFARELEPLLPTLFRGCNATVFAYGATGSGKTYTMQGLENRPGLMPLALTSILSMAENTRSRVEVSYYEVYMDRCYDLLEAKAKEVLVLEGNDGKIQLRGLSQVQVKTLEEFKEIFVNGCLRRRVGHTGLNDASSRSHGVLMVTVTRDEGNPDVALVGKLNLIDLAGNEDNRRTGNEGVRLAESARINQSLFALSNVINALNCNEIRVPYRDSKLTRILQDSLGGTSRALMIACLSPKSYQEAAHTLSLAARSRQIMNQTAPGDKRDDSQMKVDMEAKLQAWLEAKGKAPPVTPNPSRAKPLFYTPSRLQINRLRHIERNLAKDTSYVSPKVRRVLAPSRPNSSFGEDEVNHLEPNLAESVSASAPSANVEQEKQLVAVEDFRKETTPTDPKETSCPAGPQAEKENVLQEIPFTPCAKIMTGSSSPPLSVRLHNLRAAMREVLQPITTNALLESLSPKSCQNDHSDAPPLMSPKEITPLAQCHEGKSTGTPLDKFSRNSSGIKNTLKKEYLDFLNTASREELLELKGIGEKRAAYILSLREISPEPLKELEDLEKIGISKKQAQFIFKNTARQIFS